MQTFSEEILGNHSRGFNERKLYWLFVVCGHQRHSQQTHAELMEASVGREVSSLTSCLKMGLQPKLSHGFQIQYMRRWTQQSVPVGAQCLPFSVLQKYTTQLYCLKKNKTNCRESFVSISYVDRNIGLLFSPNIIMLYYLSSAFKKNFFECCQTCILVILQCGERICMFMHMCACECKHTFKLLFSRNQLVMAFLPHLKYT